jgi:cGMP-dependent protein kinase
MAPEIISGKGYSFFVDLWSIGICLYEFVCGYLPYGEELEDPFQIYESIIKTKISYPSFFKDKKTKAIIEQLLSTTPELRMGGSFAALKANEWFDNFDWVFIFPSSSIKIQIIRIDYMRKN